MRARAPGRPPSTSPGNPLEHWWKERSDALDRWFKEQSGGLQRQFERWAQEQQRRAERAVREWVERQSREIAREMDNALRQTCGAGLIVFPLVGFVVLERLRRR